MKRSETITRYENVFIRRAISQGIRLDGRTLHDYRPINLLIQRHDNYCMSEVNRADSKVICVITSYVISPYADRKNEGIINISIKSKDHSKETELKKILDKCIRSNEIIDLESLCIVSGEYVWSINIDVRVVDSSSCDSIDLVLMATFSSLRAFRKPDVLVQSVNIDDIKFSCKNLKSQIKIYDSNEREPLPLALHQVPLSLTVALFRLKEEDFSVNQKSNRFEHEYIIKSDFTNESLCLLIDPSIEEIRNCDGVIVVALNAHNELCLVSKPGGVPIKIDLIQLVIKICTKPIESIHATLQYALNQLEETVNKQKLEQLELNRQQQLLNNSIQNIIIGLEDKQSNSIDMNDPMLQWNNLHKAATLTI